MPRKSDMNQVSRRHFMAGSAAALTLFPASAFASSRRPRFVFVMLRGAMDGMGLLPPLGDPDFTRLNGRDQDYDSYTRLGSDFALHGEMKTLLASWQRKQAMIFPAAAAPYRERSHFDAQDMLEFGVASKGGARTGWMARMADRMAGSGDAGVAITSSLPIIMQGSNRTIAWAPGRMQDPAASLTDRLMQVYAERPALADALAKAMRSDDIASSMDMERAGGRGNAVKQFAELGASAARFLGAEDGPDIAMLELGGWDTHSRQSARLTQQFRALDAGLDALQTGLGDAWQDTVVFVMSEFGRTANYNGSGGTDHGTAGTVFALGGAISKGRFGGDWPGLGKSALYRERDLFPANDAYAIIAGLIRYQMGFDKSDLAHILPGIKPLTVTL